LRIHAASGLWGGVWEVTKLFRQVADVIALDFEIWVWVLGGRSPVASRGRTDSVQLASGLMGFVSDLSWRSARLIFGDVWRECERLFVEPTLMPCRNLVCTLTLFERIGQTIDALLHRSYLVAEMCDQGLACLGFVSACSSIRGIIPNQLVELMQ
jgi:hypothetical protein